MSPFAREQDALLRALVRHGVELVVVGGVAAQMHGWRGATVDLDIAVSIEQANVERLNAALADIGAGRGVPGALGTVFSTVHGRLEIVRRADGIGDYAAWLSRARPRDIGDGLAVIVANPDDVLRSKEAAGRDKDRAALPQMRRDFIEAGALAPGAARGPVAAAQAAGSGTGRIPHLRAGQAARRALRRAAVGRRRAACARLPRSLCHHRPARRTPRRVRGPPGEGPCTARQGPHTRAPPAAAMSVTFSAATAPPFGGHAPTGFPTWFPNRPQQPAPAVRTPLKNRIPEPTSRPSRHS
jgi:hypothetical protein